MPNSKFFQRSQRSSVQADPSSLEGKKAYEFHSSLVQLLIDSKNCFFNLERTLRGVTSNPNVNITDQAKKENYQNILEKLKVAGEQSEKVYQDTIASETSRLKTSA